MKHPLSEIDTIAYDFDGVFYPHLTIPDIKRTCANIWADAFNEISDNTLPLQEIRKTAQEGYEQYGDSLLVLEQWAAQKGMEIPDFKQKLFNAYFRRFSAKMWEISPHEFSPKTEMLSAFNGCEHIKKGIASHASKEHWITPVLKSMRLSRYINQNAIFGLDDGGFKPKSLYPTLIEKCFQSLGDGERRSFIEDSPKNLEVAKGHDPSIVTVFLHHGKGFRHLPTCVDYQFRNLPEMKKALKRAQSETHKIIVELSPV